MRAIWKGAGAVCLSLFLVAFAGAETPDPGEKLTGEKETGASAGKSRETVTMTGKISRETCKRRFRRWMRDEVLVLNVASESFTLLRGRNKRVVADIEGFIGKELTILGELVPPNERHPRFGFKVLAFSEAGVLPGNSPPSKAAGVSSTTPDVK
ncbi:MAG: hypothetical protein WA705_22740 [Candidatus Ozemobacteraceae bacterium]